MGIINFNIKIFLILITIFFVNTVQSQIDFIIHKVKKNQDLESIAIIYDVDETVILEFNPNTEIKKGVKLKIPKSYNEVKELESSLSEIKDTTHIKIKSNPKNLIDNINDFSKKKIAILLPLRTKNINFD